jgi:hypothetical protein
MNNIIIKKKNDDGTYDNNEYLFNSVDLYEGDHVNRILEISPQLGKMVTNVKFEIRSISNNNQYSFLPEKENSYYLVDPQHKGIKFYLTDTNKVKYLPDRNGKISISNTLSSPKEVVLHMIAEKYTIQDFNKDVVMDDMNIVFWSSDND